MTVADDNEWTSDDIYFITLAFRSRFRTPGSTRVWWSGALSDSLHLEERQQGNVPPEQVAAGEHPEIIGLCVAALEHDDSGWGAMSNKANAAVAEVTRFLRDAVENRSESEFGTGDSLSQFNSAMLRGCVVVGGDPVDLVDDDDTVGLNQLVYATVTREAYLRLWPEMSTARATVNPAQGHLCEYLVPGEGVMTMAAHDSREGRYLVDWSVTAPH